MSDVEVALQNNTATKILRFICLVSIDMAKHLQNTINVDWFQPFKHIQYSVGAIYLCKPSTSTTILS